MKFKQPKAIDCERPFLEVVSDRKQHISDYMQHIPEHDLPADYEEFKKLHSCVTHPESLDSNSFQMFMKTKSFGQISVRVKGSSTIEDVAKWCKIEVSHDYTGFDVDQVVACETSDPLTFKNKEFKPDFTTVVSYYIV